jgi:hypothetical protein
MCNERGGKRGSNDGHHRRSIAPSQHLASPPVPALRRARHRNCTYIRMMVPNNKRTTPN